MRIGFLLLLTPGFMLMTSCSRGAPEYRTDATVKDIMDSIVDPNADFLWDSVSSESTAKGLIEKAPKTDEDWKEVRRHAIALMEATNMLQIPGRAVARPGERADDPRVEEQPEQIQALINSDRASWVKAAHGLYDATSLVLKAVDAKNVDGILDAGDRIDQACEACHLKYWYPRQYELLQQNRPNASERGKK
jgi:cytochrome c556